MRALFAIAPFVFGGVFVGCATGGAVEQELSLMRRDMHGLKKEVQSQRLEIERLEGRVTLLSLGGGAPRAEPTAPLASAEPKNDVRPQIGPSRVLPVVRMRGQADANAAPVDGDWDDPGAQDDGSPPVVIKLGAEPITNEHLPVDHAVLKKPDPLLATAKVKSSAEPRSAPVPAAPAVRKTKAAKKSKMSRAEVRRAYDEALAQLREQKDVRGALASFAAFVTDHPRSRLADNALFWSGECHRTLKQPAEAKAVFADLLRSYPRSAKVPYAKVGLGHSLILLGEKEKGEAQLRNVIAEYPTSEAAREAKSLLPTHEESE